MRTNIEFSGDQDFDEWSVAITLKGNESIDDIDDKFDSLIKHIESSKLFDIKCTQCPWIESDHDTLPNEFGDIFVVDKNDCLKSEFVKEIRALVKKWKSKGKI